MLHVIQNKIQLKRMMFRSAEFPSVVRQGGADADAHLKCIIMGRESRAAITTDRLDFGTGEKLSILSLMADGTIITVKITGW